MNNLRYADDTVLIAQSQDDLQAIVNKLDRSSQKYGMEINIKKTKVMVVTKGKNVPVCNALLNETKLK